MEKTYLTNIYSLFANEFCFRRIFVTNFFFPPLIRNHILAMIHDIYARLKVLAVVRGKEQNKVSFIFQFGKKKLNLW